VSGRKLACLLAAAACGLASSGAPTVVPTPRKAQFGGGSVRTDGLAPASRDGVPPYALELGDRLLHGSLPISFGQAQALGPQDYRLAVETSGVTVAAGGGAGFVYAMATLLQLAEPAAGGMFDIPLGRVEDGPAIPFRGVSFLQFVEVRGWSQDAGDGRDALKRRFVAALDVLAAFKLNAVLVDGMGFNPERFPGYSALMRELASEARHRFIRLGFSGYSQGYGAQWYDFDGPKFENRRSYPDGAVYQCLGAGSARSKEMATCLSNEELTRLKCDNLRDFVRAVEPGFLYIHGIDLGQEKEAVAAWSNRCETCRSRWPNDDTTAADGMAGAYAGLYDRLAGAIASAKNPETGYDGARDCVYFAVGPNYTSCFEGDDEWSYHLRYVKGLFSAMRSENTHFMFREQFASNGGGRRFAEMKRAAGPGSKLAVIHFGSGDCGFNSLPLGGDPCLIPYFQDMDAVLSAGGNAFCEWRQPIVAEYTWNPAGTPYLWRDGAKSPAGSLELVKRLVRGYLEPEPLFRSGTGLAAVCCRKLYGANAGELVLHAIRNERLAGLRAGLAEPENDVGPIIPLTSERIPGAIGFARMVRKKRDLRWREGLTDGDLEWLCGERELLRASVARTREAEAEFRRAAEIVDSELPVPAATRRDVLLRMADSCRCGAGLGELTELWTDLIVRGQRALRSGAGIVAVQADLVRLENGARTWKGRFEQRLKGVLDASGGNVRFGWQAADYLLVEAANIRETFASGRYNPHPRNPWW